MVARGNGETIRTTVFPQATDINSLVIVSGQGRGRTADLPLFRPDVSPVGADRASVYALPPVAAARPWLLPLLSAQCEWFGAELLLGDHRRALGFPAVFVVANAQGQVLPCPKLL